MQFKRSLLSIMVCVLLLLPGVALAQGMPAGADTATAPPAYSRALKVGCRGTDVKALQQKLTELSFYKSTVDGVFGTGTQNSVKSFQSAHGITANGVVDKNTYDSIYGSPAPESSTPVSPTATPTGTAAPGGTANLGYTLGALNNQITLRKGSKGNNVRDLQAVLKMKGFYSGAINGVFQNETKSAVMSFQHSLGLKSDGKAGNYTLSALYTMLTPPDLNTIIPWPAGHNAYTGMPVDKLLWSVANKTFTRGMVAEIIDVRSGYVFQVKRTGGSRHADVEPLTPTDTATFFKCDGKFCWDRRPIWVIVNGRRLAASMNCMPHGYDTINGNDMRGQFCIHFVKSRTHDTNRVDPEHQACIEEAYQAALADMATPAPSPSATAQTAPLS